VTPEATTHAVRDAALDYAARGLSVIPLHAPGMRLSREASADDAMGKVPLITWKPCQQRRATAEELRGWWASWPRANLGLITGAVSGVVVFDVDSAEGWDAFTALDIAALADGAGPWVARTARGYHVFYAHPGGGSTIRNRAGLMTGVDVRADGGYVVAPPSVHASGTRYEWVTPPGFLPLAPLPRVLRALLASAANGNGHAPAPGRSADAEGIIPKGQRNDALYREARSRLARGASPETVKAVLLAENATRCVPPLSEAEVMALAGHAVEHEHAADFVRMSEGEAAAYASARRWTRPLARAGVGR